MKSVYVYKLQTERRKNWGHSTISTNCPQPHPNGFWREQYTIFPENVKEKIERKWLKNKKTGILSLNRTPVSTVFIQANTLLFIKGRMCRRKTGDGYPERRTADIIHFYLMAEYDRFGVAAVFTANTYFQAAPDFSSFFYAH
jgi:hypothetical protein